MDPTRLAEDVARLPKGGRWIEPHAYAACKAKARSQQVGWQNFGGGYARNRQNRGGTAGWAWPSSTKPARPNPQVNTKPRAPPPEPKVAGQAPLAPKVKAATQPAAQLTPAAIQDLLAQVVASLGKSGMAGQDVVKVGEAISAAIPAPEVTQKAQQDTERTWARRVNDAHGQLRRWQKRQEDCREAYRQAKRQMESAEIHVLYWERTLQAATSKDPRWETRDKLVDVNWEYDSQAGDRSEAGSEAGEDEMSTAPPTGDTPLSPTAPIPLSNQFQTLASPAFPQGPSPFNTDGTADTGPDVLKASNAQWAQLKQQGEQLGIPEHLLDQAFKEGHTPAMIISSWHHATMAANMYVLTNKEQDLSHSPLAHKMANHLVLTTAPQQQEATEAGGGTN